jgi:hypothetical protein
VPPKFPETSVEIVSSSLNFPLCVFLLFATSPDSDSKETCLFFKKKNTKKQNPKTTATKKHLLLKKATFPTMSVSCSEALSNKKNEAFANIHGN